LRARDRSKKFTARFRLRAWSLKAATTSSWRSPIHADRTELPSGRSQRLGSAERSTLLTFEVVDSSALNNPANPKSHRTIGNLQGMAQSTKPLHQIGHPVCEPHGECWQQTAEESRFDERPVIGFKITASEAGLLAQLELRRVMTSTMTARSHYDVGPPGGNTPMVGLPIKSRRTVGSPNILLASTRWGARSEAAPTTRKAGTHYYVVWRSMSVDAELTVVERNTTLTEAKCQC